MEGAVEFVDNSPYIPICVLMRRNRNDILFLCRPYKRGSVMDRFEEQYKEELHKQEIHANHCTMKGFFVDIGGFYLCVAFDHYECFYCG